MEPQLLLRPLHAQCRHGRIFIVVIIEPEESGLSYRSAVNCSQVATIHQRGDASRLRPPRGKKSIQPIGRLNEAKLAEVARALKYNLAL